MRNGTYARSHTYKTPLPMTIGMEGAGTVTALGAGVTEHAIGDRVGFCLVRGSYAESINVPAWKAVPIPRTMPLPVAAALMLQGSTAHYLSHSAFPLGPGHTCLIHAGAGGVGQLLIQLAKARGARVLTTVGNQDKAAIATKIVNRLGCRTATTTRRKSRSGKAYHTSTNRISRLSARPPR